LRTPLEHQFLANFYFSTLKDSHVDYLASLLVTILIGIAIFALVSFLKPAAPYLEWVIHFTCIALGINAVRMYFFSWFDLSWCIENPIKSILTVILVLTILWRWRRGWHTLPRLSIVLGIPLLIIYSINTIGAIVKFNPLNLFTYEKHLTPKKEHLRLSRPPIIWVIFDELDERVGFRDRPSDIEMPALDRFRGEAIVATEATPPGDVTLYSIPSLMLGKRINATKHESRFDLRLIPKDGSASLSWKKNPGILNDVHEMGLNVALLAQGGHPYCRLFGSLISYCWENDAPWHRETWTVVNRIDDLLFKVVEHIPFVSRILDNAGLPDPKQLKPDSENQFEAFVTGTEIALKDRDFDFIFIHWNLPHRPFVYDRKTNSFLPQSRVDEKPVLGYLDNLEATDRAFSAMRKALEAAGRWDEATVIVSADHRWRKAEKHDGIKSKFVPFMVKLPGQRNQFLIKQPIDTIRTRNLIHQFFKGAIKSKQDVRNVMATK
tara:strand:- start:2377 stop:3852 length:1476 start_codon:yes stop_codon:yes gene_type:complete